jgi:two-component system, NarL family, sensor histidine kinase UhpB
MKTAAKRKKTPASFEEQHRLALREYALHGGEAALGRAYELGRKALSEGKSLIEIVSLYQQDLVELLTVAKDEEQRANVLRAGTNFLAECVSPYEMAHRGFQDAIKSLRQFNEMLEEEIKRVAHAVHDDAGQMLVAVHLAVADLARGLPASQRKQVATIEELLDQVEKQLRRCSHELRPIVLDDLGWVPAIRYLAGAVSKRANLPIEVETKVMKRLPKAVEIALYRIVQEALTNITKHAQAKRVSIQVFRADHALCCSVQDDGAGFDVRAVRSNPAQRGLGLIGIQERANSIGGTVSIESSPGRGTKILIRLPMK